MKEEDILARLDSVVRSERITRLFDESVKRLSKELKDQMDELFVWETIPMSHFGNSLPSDINSCWVFLIRCGLPAEKHRHPNSIQRTLSWQGTGDLQVARAKQWVSNRLVSSRNAGLTNRWVSIPANAWHRPIITSDWAVVSFHSVAATDLIEEAGEKKKLRKYSSSK